MRVVIRRRWEADDGEIEQEVEVSVEGGYAPDCMADLIDRAYNLWGWAFDSEDEAEEP